jgi:glutathione S-transferase
MSAQGVRKTEPLLDGVKLYWGIGPNSYRVRIFMAEKGIDLPREAVDITIGEHKTSEFRAMNSLAQIPVLKLADGSVITESVAICRYLEEIVPRPPLFGSDAASKGKVEMWNRRVELEIFGTIGNVALHTDEMFKDRIAQFPAFAETQRLAVPAKWAWLDREMADGRNFIAGDNFSVADITAGVAGWLGDFFGMEIPQHLANVRRWNDRVRTRPSWDAP